MAKMMIVPLLLLSIAITCMGQTFQYSRGWTNGKRSNTRDSPFQEMMEIETEKKLERCLFNLQRFVRNSFMRPPQLMSGKQFPNMQHVENGDVIDDIIVPDNIEFTSKH